MQVWVFSCAPALSFLSILYTQTIMNNDIFYL